VLQELKAPQEKFPDDAVRAAGYGVIWHGQKSWNGVAILARNSEPTEIRRALPGDPDDANSRYIEATVNGVVIGCLYLPNGNPAPGPKFDYKLRWLDRLIAHAAELVSRGSPVVLAGDYNVIPTERDVYKPERWVDDALFRVEVREVFARLLAQGWTDAIRVLHPMNRSIRSGITSAMRMRAMPACALITCFSIPRRHSGWQAPASIETYEAGKERAITHPPGWSCGTSDPSRPWRATPTESMVTAKHALLIGNPTDKGAHLRPLCCSVFPAKATSQTSSISHGGPRPNALVYHQRRHQHLL